MKNRKYTGEEKTKPHGSMGLYCKVSNIPVIGDPGGEEEEGGTEELFEEIWWKIFLTPKRHKPTDSRNWVNSMCPHLSKAKEITPRYIAVKLLKTNKKEKNLESSQK